MANCQAGRRAGREGRKHHGSRLISSTEHREGRQHGPIETRRPRGRWCLANGRHCSPGGPGGAGKPSVSWVHSVPITLPLIPCFLSRDNIDDFFVCVSAQGSIDGADRFSNNWNLSGISSAGPLSLRDFSASCCTIGSPGHVLSSE